MLESGNQEQYRRKIEENEKVLYEVAKKFKGKTTVSDIYANTNLSIEEIEYTLAELTSKNYVKIDSNVEKNSTSYLFPELMARLGNEKSVTEKLGIDKLYLKVKYGGEEQKPLEELEKAILQTAQEFKGVLAITDIIEYTKLSVNEAEDVLDVLIGKGLCKKEFDKVTSTAKFIFPDFVSKELATIEENNSFPTEMLNKLKKGTDKFFIQGKVKRYKRKFKSAMFFDTVSPGFGQFLDGRLTFIPYFFLFILPFFLTAGITYFPSVFVSRKQTLKYYSTSERAFSQQISHVNKKSLYYIAFTAFFYFLLFGIDGIRFYYSYIFSYLGF